MAEALSVSRTPIRESLQRLAADGLVESSRRGWVVRELSLDAIREIYELREALEGFAARLTALRASESQIRKLQQMIARRPADPPLPAERQWLVTNNDVFHQTVFRACGNDRLLREIVRTSAYYFNMRVASLYSDEEVASSAQQHADLVEAIVQHAGERAEQLMRLHVRGALDVILRHAS